MSNLEYLHKLASNSLSTVAHDVIMQHPFVLVTTLTWHGAFRLVMQELFEISPGHLWPSFLVSGKFGKSSKVIWRRQTFFFTRNTVKAIRC